VAQIGAAVGREFSHELIAAVSRLAPMDLDAALERLMAAGLISRRGVPPVATYAFKHALVQDAAYVTMLKSRRQQLHAGIAKVLVERLPTLAESLPEVVAHHFTEAGLASEAIGNWRKAGQLASARSANREAVKSFEQALSILEAVPESQSTLELGFEIRIELRTVLVQLSEVRRALAQLREAETLAEQLNDDRRRGRVYNFMTSTYSLLGELDEALVTGTRALEVAGRLGDVTLRIPATTYLEQTHYFRGEFERVVELATENMAALPADRVSELFGIGAPPSIYDRSWQVMSLAQLGRFVEANKFAADAIRLAEPTHNAFAIGMAYYAASMLHLIKGDWARASTLTEHWIAVFRSTNVALLLPMAVYFSAWALAQLDEASEALERTQEAEQLLELDLAQGLVGRLGLGYHALGRACLRLGQLDEARSLGDRAVECSPGHNGLVAHALHLLGDIASHPDRFDAESGEAHYRQALALAEPRGMRPLVAHCHLGLGKLYMHTDKREQAREQLTTAARMYREMDMRFWLEQADAELRELA
jgi:tetratricopeptide (TPR) repeat protein